MDRSPPAPDLTDAQQLVCARLDAEGTFPSALGNGSVFLYRTRASGTERWLVSRAGRVVDFDFLQAGRADVAA